MTMKIKNITLIALIFCISSCHLEVNTTDPQSSRSLAKSKADSMYVCKYDVSSNECPNSQAWIEHNWKYIINHGDVHKQKWNSFQLILKINTDSLALPPETYLSSLDIKARDYGYGYFGSGNGVFFLDLKDAAFPRSLIVDVIKGTDTLCQLNLQKATE